MKNSEIKKCESENLNNVRFSSASKTLAAIMTSVYCSIVVSSMSFAAPGDAIAKALSEGASSIWDVLRAIVVPLAAVALAVCAVKILWGGQRAAEEAKSAAIKIIIAVAIVLLAPALVNAVGEWFTGKSSWSDIQSTY